jgi:hypothetical protein
MEFVHLSFFALEPAKDRFAHIYSWPGVSAAARVDALKGAAHYYTVRKEWDKMTACYEEALILFEQAREDRKGFMGTEAQEQMGRGSKSFPS